MLGFVQQDLASQGLHVRKQPRFSRICGCDGELRHDHGRQDSQQQEYNHHLDDREGSSHSHSDSSNSLRKNRLQPPKRISPTGRAAVRHFCYRLTEATTFPRARAGG